MTTDLMRKVLVAGAAVAALSVAACGKPADKPSADAIPDASNAVPPAAAPDNAMAPGNNSMAPANSVS